MKTTVFVERARDFRAHPSTGETQESMNNVSCCRDMTEIPLNWRKTPFNQSINFVDIYT